MSKYLAESFYTCLFKITHQLEEVTNESLKNLENRKDGKFDLIDIKFNKRKTRSLSDIPNTQSKTTDISDKENSLQEMLQTSQKLSENFSENKNMLNESLILKHQTILLIVITLAVIKLTNPDADEYLDMPDLLTDNDTDSDSD